MNLKFTQIILLTLVGMTVGAFRSAHADPAPCEDIQRACGMAGYTRDLPEGKDLMTQCFEPTLQGQQVPGMKPVAPKLISQCNDQLAKKKKKRSQNFSN